MAKLVCENQMHHCFDTINRTIHQHEFVKLFDSNMVDTNLCTDKEADEF